MSDLQYNLQFEKVCDSLQLGKMLAVPAAVTGGFLHRMYALETECGKFAVKALNPQIMLRPTAMQNYINSEKIADTASKHIPAVTAKKLEGSPMINIDNQYYLVFDWIPGKCLKSDEIQPTHCKKIGSLLANIHMTDFAEPVIHNNPLENKSLVNWDYYIQKGQEINSEWAKQLADTSDLLYSWNLQVNQSSKLLATHMVISHRDLDPKNVMWHHHNPTIIDWEAAGYINPMQDLIETAIYWSETGAGDVIKERFVACIDGYKNEYGTLHADWKAVLVSGFSGKLGWLEYNLKRSLLLECTDQEEQQMGSREVKETIKSLIRYANMIPQVEAWLHEI